ncbi:ABC transporter ATP-binding protein [candidate division WOR-3 bacterium]|nr:ABC transporter ATP-binding protein [candidate division WOR-3 bacterium]
MGKKQRKELLKVENLKTHFVIEEQKAKAVDGLDFYVFEGEFFGIVGESGSGKSVTALSILRLIPDPPGKISSGKIFFGDKDLLGLSWEDMRKIRGNEISMIFQEPMTSLNPVFTVGVQIMEPLIIHRDMDKREARAEAIKMLKKVGIPSPELRVDDYPHQFSGGMRQRAMIAMALCCNPSLLIADEPTTALDVTVQAQILELMTEIKNKRKESAIILITHDLAVIAETCDRVMVMYCGKIQEVASTVDLFENPLHPYTKGLMASIPSLAKKKKRLTTIPGNVPGILHFPPGCPFHTRCKYKMPVCEKVVPELLKVEKDHLVRCHLYNGEGKNR